MKEVTKLVRISLVTRVIVDENATDEQILEMVKPNFQLKLDNNELLDNLESIKVDNEIEVDISHPKLFTIDGYFKDNKEQFNWYLVTEDIEPISVVDEYIFFYGLTEDMIKQCIINGEDTMYDFVITSYRPW